MPSQDETSRLNTPLPEDASATICPFTLEAISAIAQEDRAVIYQCNNPAGPEQKVGCGHSCNLLNLVSYLHDSGGAAASIASKSISNVSSSFNSSSRAHLCPVCLASPVGVVCDELSSSFLMRRRDFIAEKSNSSIDKMNIDKQNKTADDENNDGKKKSEEGRIASFRYGSIFYFLWIESSSCSEKSKTSSYSSFSVSKSSIKKSNALERIGTVLGMDVVTGLKVRFSLFLSFSVHAQ